MTAPGPLARVRALAPVAALAELWQQRDDEPAPAYEAFLAWLSADPRTAPVPGTESAAWAARYEWAERAQAYESARALATPAPGCATPEARIISNLTQMVRLETDKLLRQAAQSPQPVVSVKDLVAVMGLVQELHDKGKAATEAAGSASALEGLTTEEKRVLLKVMQQQRKSAIK